MDVESVFPGVSTIADDSLRAGAGRAWEQAAADAGVSDLEAVPWFPPAQAERDLPDERLVPHVRDVTALAAGMAETLEARGRGGPDRDLVVAGALVHDVSKLYEFDGDDRTAIGRLLGHPYYGVAVTAQAGLPPAVAHVVLSHTPRTNVEPASIEAEIVRGADEVAAGAIRRQVVDDRRDA
jgi:putative nucleotidyltransferase with HDIG domain